MTQPAIDVQAQNVWHRYPAEPQPLLALRNVNLTIEAGQFVSLVGVSGCGKSTLMRLLAGLLEPSEGRVHLAGRSPHEMRAQKQISWMAQQAALLPWRTVLENVTLPLQVNPQARANASASPEALLQMVKLGDFAHVYPQTLSGGMQQRVALARALATGASLWLMDEPFAALDELTRARLAHELLGIWRRFRPTVVWITHNLHEAIRLSDRVVVMTPRPGTIAGEVPVDLPHPRDDTGPAFAEKLRQARALLQEEAVI
ncbi:MAG TPA: ABC transporter ATP-binding protein [Candidatus Sulfomarinibacteraceae bacterium]|nr:ABC transporter ATP-binding protein [Candidatus Sulfomarinibacteraceae bacterium]